MAKKRVNGEGTIGKRKDGRWEARYIAGRDPETGKQIRKSILGKTQAEVRAKLKDALAEAAEIDVVKSERIQRSRLDAGVVLPVCAAKRARDDSAVL